MRRAATPANAHFLAAGRCSGVCTRLPQSCGSLSDLSVLLVCHSGCASSNSTRLSASQRLMWASVICFRIPETNMVTYLALGPHCCISPSIKDHIKPSTRNVVLPRTRSTRILFTFSTPRRGAPLIDPLPFDRALAHQALYHKW